MADRNTVRVPRQREATTQGNYASLYVDEATGRVTVRHPGGGKADLQRPNKIGGNPAKCMGDLHVVGQVGVGVASPDASSALEIVSTTQGLLLPRMTTTQRDAIGSPPDGLALYNSTDSEAQFRADSAWVAVGGGSGASLANDGNNRITTATGSGGINGEANLTFDGSTLSVTGGVVLAGSAAFSTPKTSSYTAAVSDYVIGVNTSGGAVTITLPDNAPRGTTHVIKCVGGVAGTNAITVSRNSSDLIDGQTSHQITNNYGAITVASDGANWYII